MTFERLSLVVIKLFRNCDEGIPEWEAELLCERFGIEWMEMRSLDWMERRVSTRLPVWDGHRPLSSDVAHSLGQCLFRLFLHG